MADFGTAIAVFLIICGIVVISNMVFEAGRNAGEEGERERMRQLGAFEWSDGDFSDEEGDEEEPD
jgi:hypothetical protein